MIAGLKPYAAMKNSGVPWLGVIQRQLLQARNGVGIAHFGPTHLKRLWIALPPPEEQREILDALQQKTVVVSRALDLANREILLFREIRTRLIADVVTGKLDAVR